ncbi:MAG: V-type ATPase subunit [Planctomycetota bacterium]|jgi:V/A-type H+-transporting ATPase subunit C
MSLVQEQGTIDFFCYPPVGEEDWRYMFSSAKVRVLESMMLERGVLLDMANAEDFEAALEMLSGSEYALSGRAAGSSEVEKMLLERRRAARELFVDLMLDDEYVQVLSAREDFANMRLAVRRVVTEKPIGLDYSDEGSVSAEEFEDVFEQENYSRFPDYMQEAVEAAILGYYQNKDIRRIDYEIDRVEAGYDLKRAGQIGSVFLESLFRTRVDLANIRTMLRLKLSDQRGREFFLPGGFVETDRLVHCSDIGYEAIAPLFYATPYHAVVDSGVSYLSSEGSFLHLERSCQDHMMGFLKTTTAITAGPQPVVAYLLMKENEIRAVRMVLACKKNRMDTKFILDRLGEN